MSRSTIRFTVAWTGMMLLLLYAAVVFVHNRKIKWQCAEKEDDPFKAYDCWQERKW